jgi:VWFA-related protein
MRILAAMLGFAGAAVAAAPSVFQVPSRPPRDITRNAVATAAIDVSVRDAKTGEPVRDLKRDEFEVSVGGVRQRLATASLVRERIVVIFVDELHLDFNSTVRSRELLRRVAAELGREGDLVAFATAGPSQISGAMSTESAAAAEAIRAVAGNGLRPGEIPGGPPEAQPEVLYRVHLALATACEHVLRLEEYRGRRKTMVYFSNGYDVGPLATQGAPPAIPGSPASSVMDFKLGADFAALVAAARRMNVTIHTLDAGGIAGNEMTPDPRLAQTEWERVRKGRQASLRELSQATGGLTVTSASDLAASLKLIAAAATDYYIVEFYADRGGTPARDAIEVRVTRPGVTVDTAGR